MDSMESRRVLEYSKYSLHATIIMPATTTALINKQLGCGIQKSPIPSQSQGSTSHNNILPFPSASAFKSTHPSPAIVTANTASTTTSTGAMSTRNSVATGNKNTLSTLHSKKTPSNTSHTNMTLSQVLGTYSPIPYAPSQQLLNDANLLIELSCNSSKSSGFNQRNIQELPIPRVLDSGMKAPITVGKGKLPLPPPPPPSSHSKKRSISSTGAEENVEVVHGINIPPCKKPCVNATNGSNGSSSKVKSSVGAAAGEGKNLASGGPIRTPIANSTSHALIRANSNTSSGSTNVPVFASVVSNSSTVRSNRSNVPTTTTATASSATTSSNNTNKKIDMIANSTNTNTDNRLQRGNSQKGTQNMYNNSQLYLNIPVTDSPDW